MQTLTATKINSGISSAKANRLYWLGRYAERVYLTLHMLRKHFDLMIDEDKDSYISFCTKMGIENKYTSADDFTKRYLFDCSNPESVINMLERVKDNAMMLREEIMTETLCYIELSIAHMNKPEVQNKGIEGLQRITDYMLAFWGSIDERIVNNQIRHSIKFGKYLESLDLHIRFDYQFNRVEEIFARMLHSVEQECYICDELTLLTLKQHMTFDDYKNIGVLQLINSLFRS
ncbi:MAG: alpha-E domain-containing protein [Paludibacter sp.]|nr:alpha-E domain-containing protein [Paludibacter sp.]